MNLRLTSIAFLILLAPLAAQASAGGQAVRLNVVSQPLADVVDTLSFMSGIPVTTSGKLTGQIDNWSVNEEGVAAFAALGRVNNLFVAFDGSRVIIAPKSEVATVLLEQKRRDWKVTRSAIDALFPVFPEDAIRYDATSGLVIVRGPAAFISAIETVLNRSTEDTVQVIKGGSVEMITPPVAAN
jgi:type II secretory pathway component GspD/PulD (secretin)